MTDISPTSPFAAIIETAIQLAALKGYAAGAELLADAYPAWQKELLDPRNTDWYAHCAGLQRGHACLLLGSRWGGSARALARHFDTVWSLELDPACLKFQAAFRHAEGISNLFPLQASPFDLPFSDASFDLVAAPMVWSWLRQNYAGMPEESLTRRRWLMECRRVLAPDGALIFGLEHEPPVGLRKRRHTPRLPSTLHGFSGASWIAQLRASGFKNPERYWAWPGLLGPKCSGRLEPPSLQALLQRQACDPQLRLEARLRAAACANLARLHFPVRPGSMLARWLAPAEFWIAPVSALAHKPTLAKAVGNWEIAIGGSDKLIWLHTHTGGISVVKTPRWPQAQAQVEKQEMLAARHGGLCIEPLQAGDWMMFREWSPPGRMMRSGCWRECLAAVRWLARFQQATIRGQRTAGELAAEIEGWLRQFRQLARRPAIQQRLESSAQAFLAGISALPIVIEHGDYWPGNILVRRDGKVTVIDWEHARPFGDPLFDIATLTHQLWLQWRAQLLGGARFRRRRKLCHVLDEYTRAMGIPARLIYAYMPLVPLRQFLRNHTHGKTFLLRLLERWDLPSTSECGLTGVGCGSAAFTFRR